MMEQLFIRILNMSLTSGIVILAVMMLRLFLRKAPKIFSYVLWVVVLFRLFCPFSFSSALSLLNFFQMPVVRQGEMEYIPENIGLMKQPAVNMPIPALEDAVNSSLPAARGAASVNPMQVVLFIGAYLWLAGIFIMIAYSVISYLMLQQKFRSAERKKDNIYITSRITVPFVCGIFIPRIYLPSSLEKEEEKYILLHEQIHIRRKDHIWRIFSYFVLCLHWFNPLVWLAFFLSGKDMEMSCDEAVIRILGNSVKKEYSASLLSFASGRRIVLGMPLAFGEGETGSRIRNVLRYKKPAKMMAGAVIAVCVLAAIMLAANPRADGKEDDEVVLSEEETGEISDEILSDINENTEDEQADASGKEGISGQDREISAEQEVAALTPESLLQGSIADGTYRVYVRSVSRSARGIDRYIVDDIDDDEELLFLAFADDCKFLINEEMDSISYGEVAFETFADLSEEAFSFLNPPMLLTFKDGLITEAVLETYYGSGISYAAMTPSDDWYEHIQEAAGMDEEEVLAAYYTLADTVKMDIGDGEGMERIEVYTGNIGDGDSGIVLFYDASDRLLYSESAHIARAGWNNIFLGERDGIGYIMTVHIEDRDTYGEYAYQVFRLSEDGTARQMAGSSLEFDDDRIPYDDELFAEWVEKLYGYLADSRLALSIQEGEVRLHEPEAEGYDFISISVR